MGFSAARGTGSGGIPAALPAAGKGKRETRPGAGTALGGVLANRFPVCEQPPGGWVTPRSARFPVPGPPGCRQG